MQGVGFRVQGSGFGFGDSGFGGSGFGLGDSGFGGSGFGMKDSDFLSRVSDSGSGWFRVVNGSGFEGSGFGSYGFCLLVCWFLAFGFRQRVEG